MAYDTKCIGHKSGHGGSSGLCVCKLLKDPAQGVNVVFNFRALAVMDFDAIRLWKSQFKEYNL